MAGTRSMDVLCQYRAPAPCRSGYAYFSPTSSDAQGEYGQPSCVKVLRPSTFTAAVEACGVPKGPSGDPSPWVPGFTSRRNLHLVAMSSLSDASGTLPDLLRRLARKEGLWSEGATLWTGGQVFQGQGVWDTGESVDPALVTVTAGAPLSNATYVPRAWWCRGKVEEGAGGVVRGGGGCGGMCNGV